MTIEREGSVYTKGSVYTIKCDICGDVIYMEKTDDFNDAVNRKKESGWKSTNTTRSIKYTYKIGVDINGGIS